MDRFVIRIPAKKPPENHSDLPNPEETADPYLTEAINDEVILARESSKQNIRKRKQYGHYSDDTRIKVAKYAGMHGIANTVRYFERTQNMKINESTIRGWLKLYKEKLSSGETSKTITSIMKERGAPLKAGKFEPEIRQYLQALRQNGAPVSRAIAISTGNAVVEFKEKSLLKKYGGTIEFGKPWAVSLFRRMGWVKRKGTKAARQLPTNFLEQKDAYIKLFTQKIEEGQIPKDLVINWDQTAVPIVPLSDYTMDQEGVKQVSIIAKDDKRQITAVLAVSLAGKLLPPQLIYAGKSDKCHPDFQFPKNWDVTHTDSHWSTSDSMIRYIEKIILPFVKLQKEHLNLPSNQRSLVIFDILRTQALNNEMKKTLQENCIDWLIVPARCTSELQPLDSDGSVNCILKKQLKCQFKDFYAGKLLDGLSSGVTLSSINIDLRLSVMKPLQCKWLIKALEHVETQSDAIITGWRKTGLLDAYEKCKVTRE